MFPRRKFANFVLPRSRWNLLFENFVETKLWRLPKTHPVGISPFVVCVSVSKLFCARAWFLERIDGGEIWPRPVSLEFFWKLFGFWSDPRVYRSPRHPPAIRLPLPCKTVVIFCLVQVIDHNKVRKDNFGKSLGYRSGKIFFEWRDESEIVHVGWEVSHTHDDLSFWLKDWSSSNFLVVCFSFRSWIFWGDHVFSIICFRKI